jgi:hypothetical protein
MRFIRKGGKIIPIGKINDLSKKSSEKASKANAEWKDSFAKLNDKGTGKASAYELPKKSKVEKLKSFFGKSNDFNASFVASGKEKSPGFKNLMRERMRKAADSEYSAKSKIDKLGKIKAKVVKNYKIAGASAALAVTGVSLAAYLSKPKNKKK